MLGLIIAIVAAVVVVAAVLADSLSRAGQDADSNFGDGPVGETTAHCPERHVWQWDPPHTSSRNQFVNLPADWDPPNNGRTVNLQGHVEPRAGGINVLFNIIANTANEPDTPAASLGSTSITTDGNGAGSVQLTLPFYGGAKFKVGGKTDNMDNPVESGELTVWRKVFYQVTEMAASSSTPPVSFTAPADMISQLQASFDPVFFKFDPGTKSHDTTPYQEHLTAAQRGQLETSLRPSARDNRSPFKMNIVLIDQADIVAEQLWINAATTAIVETPYFLRWAHEPTVIFADYQNSAGTWGHLVNVASPLHPTDPRFTKVTATIPGFVEGTTFNVRIRYRYQRGNAGGWGGTTGTLFMCIGRQRRANAATPTGADLQQALTHETGHALGLVPTGAGWRDTNPRDNGYSLRHCGYRTTATPPEPRCVMWYMLGGSGDRLRFCSTNRPDDCAHFLLRTDYSSISWI
jgi:hypothetical protein